jgi:hypothetical protein
MGCYYARYNRVLFIVHARRRDFTMPRASDR